MSVTWQPVSSSNINSVGYDEELHVLHVRFNNGSEYKYFNVPQDEYEALVSAPSVGSYLNDSIKGVYKFARV